MFTATISVAVEDFALAHALQAVPEMEVKAERLAGHSRHWVMPCLWTTGGDFEDFEVALADDSTVAEVVTGTDYGSEKFYQIDWSEDIKETIDIGLDSAGSLLRAETTNHEWRLSIRFASRDQFDQFRSHLDEQGISFRLEDLTQAERPQQFMGGLTAPQRDALVTAVSEGYFAIPREATMEDVAEILDISVQAASERLRRGVEQFVATMLVASEEQLEE